MIPCEGFACLRKAWVAVGETTGPLDTADDLAGGIFPPRSSDLGCGLLRDAAGPVGGTAMLEGFALGDFEASALLLIDDDGIAVDVSSWALVCKLLGGVVVLCFAGSDRAGEDACDTGGAVFVLTGDADPPRRPPRPPRPGPPPSPRSRCSIRAATLGLTRSRFFSARGAGEAGAATAGSFATGGGSCFFAIVACLLRTLTASRAAFSTLMACALLLSGEEAATGLVGVFFSEIVLALLSLES